MNKHLIEEAAKQAVKKNFPNPTIIWADLGGKEFQQLMIDTVVEVALSLHSKDIKELRNKFESFLRDNEMPYIEGIDFKIWNFFLPYLKPGEGLRDEQITEIEYLLQKVVDFLNGTDKDISPLYMRFIDAGELFSKLKPVEIAIDSIVNYLKTLPPKESNKSIDKSTKKCKHNFTTLYTPETGTVCSGCKQKLVSIRVTEKEAKEHLKNK